jgi:hypothetical protein
MVWCLRVGATLIFPLTTTLHSHKDLLSSYSVRFHENATGIWVSGTLRTQLLNTELTSLTRAVHFDRISRLLPNSFHAASGQHV